MGIVSHPQNAQSISLDFAGSIRIATGPCGTSLGAEAVSLGSEI